jgi:hypothetical protein
MIMKKFLLFFFAIAVMTTVNAATVSWTVPADTLYGNTVVTAVPGVTLRFMDASYNKQAVGTSATSVPALTLGSTSFTNSWQGINNPTPWLHGNNYAMWAFDCTTSGTLRAAFAINRTKTIYATQMPIMTKDGLGSDITYTSTAWVSEYCYAMVAQNESVNLEAPFAAMLNTNTTAGSTTLCSYVSPYIGVKTGRLWNADSLAAATAGTNWISEIFRIEAVAGKSYCIFCTGSKLGFFGFDFTAGGLPATNVTNPDVSATIVSTKYFTLTGTEVRNVTEGVTMPGMYIAKNKMSDGKTQTVKFMVK